MIRSAFVKTILSALAVLLCLSTATMAADPPFKPTPIRFAAGTSSGHVEGGVIRAERDVYSVGARAGQTMTVTISSLENNAVFQIYEPGTTVSRDADRMVDVSGTALAGEDKDIMRWSGTLPKSGTYLIVVGGTRGNASYKMDVGIR